MCACYPPPPRQAMKLCWKELGIQVQLTKSQAHARPSGKWNSWWSCLSGSSRTERLWKEYFTDPSLWWDKRNSKRNPRSPDFKHKITKESLWIDGLYNPSWVKGMLHKTESVSREMHKSRLQEKSRWEMLSLEEALISLERMPQPPSVANFSCILDKCRKNKNIACAQRLHAYMCQSGLDAHRSLGNYLVPILVDVGSMCDAQQVFNKLVDRNEYSWTSLISGYIECGESQLALSLYQKMQEDSVHPSGHTFVALLKGCAKLKDADRGRELHSEVARNGLERDLFVGNTLVHMYAKCGLLAEAKGVFDELPVRDVVSWTALVSAYAEHGLGEDALNCFEQMLLEGVSPNAFTFVCSLKACGSIGAIDKGQELHAEIAGKGFCERDPFVGSALVDMYAKCGLLAKAQEVFDEFPLHSDVLWNALIEAYAEHGLGGKALNCLDQMKSQGISLNAVTFISSLKACGSIGAIVKGEEIHADIAKKGLLEKDAFVGNALVDMYAKCGSLTHAREVFDKLPVRNVVSWNALISGYAKHGHGDEALACFKWMQREGVSPDALTFVCSLKACGSIGEIDRGREIHNEVATKGWERDLLVGSSLVDMYAKCGLPAEAQEVFDKLPVRDVVTWTALIAGYAHLGDSESVFYMLERMRRDGIQPNGVTFVSVLAVCSHTGLVDKGQKYFEAMNKDYGISPTVGHHTCMVDLFGRAGQLDEAVAMMMKMPFHPNLAVYHTVLGACRKWGNVELGQQAFGHALQLDEKDAAACVLMSNIYVDAELCAHFWFGIHNIPKQNYLCNI